MIDRVFLFEADQLALDFLNAGRHEGLGASPEALTAWLLQASLATDADARRLAASPPLARMAFHEALVLMDALEAALEAFRTGAPVPAHAIHALNRALDERRVALRLEPRGSGAALEEEVELRFPLGLLAPVAAAGAQLLATGDRSRVRRCAADGCGRWFHDVSRNGRRRWCSMARCGNRAKVAAHYRRQRAEAGSPSPEAPSASAS